MEFVSKIGTHSLHGFSGYIKIKILESYQEYVQFQILHLFKMLVYI